MQLSTGNVFLLLSTAVQTVLTADTNEDYNLNFNAGIELPSHPFQSALLQEDHASPFWWLDDSEHNHTHNFVSDDTEPLLPTHQNAMPQLSPFPDYSMHMLDHDQGISNHDMHTSQRYGQDRFGPEGNSQYQIPSNSTPTLPEVDDIMGTLDDFDSLEFEDTSNNEHPSGSLSPDNSQEKLLQPYQRGFASVSWTRGLSKAKRDNLYAQVTYAWPTDLDLRIAKRWDSSLSKWLGKDPYLIQGLLSGNEKSFREVWEWCQPGKMAARSMKRAGSSTAKRTRTMTNRLVEVKWLAGKIFYDDKTKIVSRLSDFWEGTSKAATYSRLINYTNTYGVIQSPEPLLSDDKDEFEYAASLIAIGPIDNKRAVRHVDAGENDILHQYSAQYSKYGDIIALQSQSLKQDQIRLTAKRYTSGQAWLHNLSPSQIDLIHNLIASHWIDNLYRHKKSEYFVVANEYLGSHPNSLMRLKQGDDQEAWQIARAIAEKPYHVKSYDRYSPSQEYLRRIAHTSRVQA